MNLDRRETHSGVLEKTPKLITGPVIFGGHRHLGELRQARLTLVNCHHSLVLTQLRHSSRGPGMFAETLQILASLADIGILVNFGRHG